ncbi:hypothetical protein BN126310190 [Stenotrophomonas indicatrix]|nr:hypothetical protein BN126310190 [Stenotrophomonas indicatrix]
MIGRSRVTNGGDSRPDSVRSHPNGQVSALRTLSASHKTLMNQRLKVGTGIALYFLRQEGLQTKAD